MNCDLVIWTQPSGPLCLWQCFCLRIVAMDESNFRICAPFATQYSKHWEWRKTWRCCVGSSFSWRINWCQVKRLMFALLLLFLVKIRKRKEKGNQAKQRTIIRPNGSLNDSLLIGVQRVATNGLRLAILTFCYLQWICFNHWAQCLQGVPKKRNNIFWGVLDPFLAVFELLIILMTLTPHKHLFKHYFMF